LFAVSGFSQLLKPVKIDSVVTVSLPPGYQKKDTLDQRIFSANGLYGYMVVIRAANAKNNTPLKKEKDLNKVLQDYVKGIQGQSGDGSAQNVRDTTIGTLKAKIFTLKTDDGNGVFQFRNFILVYTREVTYTFEYGYPDNRKDMVKDEFKAYTASIKLSPELQRNDQYLSNAKGLSSNAKIAIFGGGGLIIILTIILIIRIKRKLAIN
jgi:hypothetical protein